MHGESLAFSSGDETCGDSKLRTPQTSRRKLSGPGDSGSKPRKAKSSEPDVASKRGKNSFALLHGLTQEKLKSWQGHALMGSCVPQDVKQTLPCDVQQSLKETWLAVSESGMTCIACKRANLTGAWAEETAGADVQDLRAWYLTKHNQSKAHGRAVQQYLNLGVGPVGAPDLSEFESMLKSAQEGDSLRKINPFKAMSDKTALMMWVLQEALLNFIRKDLMQAETISLMRDARRQRLLIRYGLCKTNFEVCSGILGVARDFGDTGGDIVRATRHILKRVCTEYACPPRWYRGPESRFLKDVYNHARRGCAAVRCHVSICCTRACARD